MLASGRGRSVWCQIEGFFGQAVYGGVPGDSWVEIDCIAYV